MSSVLERMERQAVRLGSPRATPPPPVSIVDLEELAAAERRRWKEMSRQLRLDGAPIAAEGVNYIDSLPPFNSADFATVTLASTSKELWPTALWTSTPSGGRYWWPGKMLQVTAFGKITTAATPGNLTVEIRYGTGDAGGTLLATSAALTLIASQTGVSWRAEFTVECRAIGASTNGSLFAWGFLQIGVAVVAAGFALIPASSAVAVGIDTTAASGISLQAKRSGSTVETMTAQDMQFKALN